jgi:hypothetical protein
MYNFNLWQNVEASQNVQCDCSLCKMTGACSVWGAPSLATIELQLSYLIHETVIWMGL